MATRQLHDVHPGQIWRDRDKRMLSGNRRVLVLQCVRDGEKVTVLYKGISSMGQVFHHQMFRSRYDRFQRAFDFIAEAHR